jgi:hypothetical protein
MSRISKLRESTETKLSIMEKHAFALETFLREGQEEALHRLEVLKEQVRERLGQTLAVFGSLEGLPLKTILELSFKLGRLSGILEEISAITADALRAQEERITEAIRDFGAFYDENMADSVTALDEIEKEVFLVGIALEAEFETIGQWFLLKGTDMETALLENRDIILGMIDALKAKIQVARDDPALATMEFMATLSADLAGIRSQFKGV